MKKPTFNCVHELIPELFSLLILLVLAFFSKLLIFDLLDGHLEVIKPINEPLEVVEKSFQVLAKLFYQLVKSFY